MCDNHARLDVIIKIIKNQDKEKEPKKSCQSCTANIVASSTAPVSCIFTSLHFTWPLVLATEHFPFHCILESNLIIVYETKELSQTY
jgi:hypothetical protein